MAAVSTCSNSEWFLCYLCFGFSAEFWHALKINSAYSDIFTILLQALTFHKCKNLKIHHLLVIDSQQMHVSFTSCLRVVASNLKVIAPGFSPNTDGIHISASKGVTVKNSIISTGQSSHHLTDYSIFCWVYIYERHNNQPSDVFIVVKLESIVEWELFLKACLEEHETQESPREQRRFSAENFQLLWPNATNFCQFNSVTDIQGQYICNSSRLCIALITFGLVWCPNFPQPSDFVHQVFFLQISLQMNGLISYQFWTLIVKIQFVDVSWVDNILKFILVSFSPIRLSKLKIWQERWWSNSILCCYVIENSNADALSLQGMTVSPLSVILQGSWSETLSVGQAME